MIPFLVEQRGDVEVAFVREIEGELQTGDEALFARGEELIHRLAVGADLERHVAQGPMVKALVLKIWLKPNVLRIKP